MADKYHNLIGTHGIRGRIERLDGNPMSAAARSGKRWWSREFITIMVNLTGAPSVHAITEASTKLVDAMITLKLGDWLPKDGGMVEQANGTRVKHSFWAPAGTAAEIGIPT